MILEGIVAENETRRTVFAFPAEMVEEEAEELGPLDDAEEPEREVIGKNVTTAVEKEQEFLDSLQADGFPEDEQKRRTMWLKVPRATRMAIRRMHKMLHHKPKAVMLQVLKGVTYP